MKHYYTSKKGFGLLELMLSLVIVALLLIMATRYYQTTVTSQKINQMIAMIQSISSSANTYQSTNNSFTGMCTGDTCSKLFLTGIPSSDQTTDGKVNNPFGGNLKITATDATTYTVEITNAPQAACVKLINYFKGNTNLHFTTPSDDNGCTVGSTPMTYTYKMGGF